MTRKYGYILVLVALMLVLAACRPHYEVQEPSYPTLPTIPMEKTPAQMLSAAISQTKNEENYEVRYGIQTVVGTEKEETEYTQTVTKDYPLDRDEMKEKVPELSVADDFLQRFCNRSMRIIPSNSGVIRYEVMDLSGEDARELLYGDGAQTEDGQMIWSVSLIVDAAGRLSGFEITSEGEEETRQVFLSIIFPENS